MMSSSGKMEIVRIRLQVESVEGFSGHSDRRQIINYIMNLKPNPERVVVCHGEKKKSRSIANFIKRRCGIHTMVPATMETFRLL